MGKRNVGTAVNVGSGVKVFRGVGIRVSVEVGGGMAAIVCAEAASAVWPMNMLIAFESSGGTAVGVANDGTQPIIRVRMMKQIDNFIFGINIFPLAHQSRTLADAALINQIQKQDKLASRTVRYCSKSGYHPEQKQTQR